MSDRQPAPEPSPAVGWALLLLALVAGSWAAYGWPAAALVVLTAVATTGLLQCRPGEGARHGR